ncbi:RHS repeat domain-containing protein [Flavobacterium lipolyticum]|uniref:RHS repeat-associated core domain-containing protein n=1 Tax=Flavobacterium lipolyticum TaxID=2893754 RepID=A0ABS8M5W2_9FLAO|nr:RHS repeat-associated core domain-containing protein [Flavobacterium sp. F-126]MCC9020227.1 hypothetical protein [Flavobacterium sp. F-126]
MLLYLFSDVTSAIRTYGYQYDQLNRLLEATYKTPNLADNKNYFGESMDYDKNGNITKLQRQYMAGVSSNPYVGDMDILGYFYETNSNRLMKVTDTSNQLQGFNDDSNGFNDSGDDYAYDLNGNLIKDENKNITGIVYNHLNLPKKIVFGTAGSIEYIYNATGQKLEKIVKETSGTVHTDYLGGFQYRYVEGQGDQKGGDQGGGNEGGGDPPAPEDPNDPKNPPIFTPDPVKDPPVEANRFGGFTAQSASRAAPSRPTLEFFPTAEGYYDYIGKKYVYQYKDHLGNIRLSYAKNPATQVLTIIDENNYYPFGLKHNGYNDYVPTSNKYKYNGKELQDELQLNVYDYGARNYDPALGRWMNIDPLAEQSRRWSPYNYTYNNPNYFIDPDGMLVDTSKIKEEGKDDGSSMGKYLEEQAEISKKSNEEFKKYLESVKSDNDDENESNDKDDDDDQRGKKVTKQSAGIKKGDTAETMVAKILKAMKTGDYIDGGDLSFLNSQIGLILDEATMGANGELNIERTFAGRVAGIGSDAKLSLKAGTLNGMKGFNFKLSGVSDGIKKKIYTSGFINDNKLYVNEKGKLYVVPIN